MVGLGFFFYQLMLNSVVLCITVSYNGKRLNFNWASWSGWKVTQKTNRDMIVEIHVSNAKTY